MSKKLLVVAAPLLIALLLTTDTAVGGGGDLNLWVNVTNADTVGVEVNMGGVPRTRCSAHVQKGNRTEELPPVWTKKKGGARWSWWIAGNVSRGKWTFWVRCWGHGAVRHAHRSFFASGGIGRRSRHLWVPSSLHAESVVLSADPEGNGGGSAPLYPVGQCTWWVARLRPDLPLFKGRSGDALNWANTARADGFPVGESPAVGAVAVFQPNQYGAGRYGHVAVVTAVDGDEMTISEANFRGRSARGTRTIPWSGLQFIYYKKAGVAPSSGVQLLSPAQDSFAQGIVPVSASSNAEAVRFEAYFFSDPSKRPTGHWVTIGTDSTSSDGFTIGWDTTTVPNQGGPGGSSVKVAAVALDSGASAGSVSTVRVNVANRRNQGGQIFYPYYVVGTCDEEECGLSLQSGTGYSGYSSSGTRYDGEEVDVVCQAHGEIFTSRHGGGSTDIWDRLIGGEWVSDYYVDTANRGVPSPPVPLCP
jgi:surface antigen